MPPLQGGRAIPCADMPYLLVVMCLSGEEVQKEETPKTGVEMEPGWGGCAWGDRPKNRHSSSMDTSLPGSPRKKTTSCLVRKQALHLFISPL